MAAYYTATPEAALDLLVPALATAKVSTLPWCRRWRNGVARPGQVRFAAWRRSPCSIWCCA